MADKKLVEVVHDAIARVVFSEGFCWTIDSFEGFLSRRTGVGGVSSRPWLIALFDGSDV
jgi:hypothetical protein